METIILIRSKLTTLDELTEDESEGILIDASRVSNIIDYEILEVEIEKVNE